MGVLWSAHAHHTAHAHTVRTVHTPHHTARPSCAQGVRNPLDPNQPKRTVEASGISVRLFDASLDDGRRVLLKEFLGDARSIASNEASMYELLYSRANPPAGGYPLGQLLGRMVGDASFASDEFREAWASALPTTPPPASDGLWLVFEWDGLSTVSSFPRAPQKKAWSTSLFDVDGRAARAERSFFVRVVAGRILQAVGWLHAQGVVHRSLGGSSLLLSTTDQTQPQLLSVRAIDLGFAATSATLTSDETAAAMARGATSPLDVIPFLARADDLHAVAYVILELVLGSAAEPPPADPPPWGAAADAGADAGAGAAPPSDLQSLKRLVEDVFSGDVKGAFRSYCAEEAAWAAAVELLDEKEGAGWDVLQRLVDCRDATSEAAKGVSAAELLESPWFED